MPKSDEIDLKDYYRVLGGFSMRQQTREEFGDLLLGGCKGGDVL